MLISCIDSVHFLLPSFQAVEVSLFGYKNIQQTVLKTETETAKKGVHNKDVIEIPRIIILGTGPQTHAVGELCCHCI